MAVPKRLLLGLSMLAVALVPVAFTLPVFPGAVGFGTETPAGRGGTVYAVTTLNDGGSGSLRDAVNASGPRIIVFEISGTIELKSDLDITNPYITIAGQTAPSPGITIRNRRVRIATHDVLIQHIRVRVGDTAGGTRDGIAMDDPNPSGPPDIYNIVIDRCSVSWARDENISFWYNNDEDGTHDITVSNSIISEGLHVYDHSMGMLVGRHSDRIAIVRNLFAHNHARNPVLQGGTSAIVINNVVYNSMFKGIMLQNPHSEGPQEASIIGNSVILGPDSTTGPEWAVYIQDDINRGSQIFIEDNECVRCGADPWSGVINQASNDVRVAEPTLVTDSLIPWRASEIEHWVLDHAGARAADRDSVDTRVVASVRNRTGRIIDSQSDVGGFPELAVRTRALSVPTRPHEDDDGDGYSNVEEWLHGYSLAVQSGDGTLPGGEGGDPAPPEGLRVLSVPKQD